VPSRKGRRVVVTGAGRGLGFSLARAIGAAGAEVILAELDADRGKVAETALVEAGLAAEFIQTDVADPASVDDLRDRVLGSGPLYGLVNNAGLADAVGGRLCHEISIEDFDRVMTVNARGPWLVARAFIPAMLEAEEGRIVNMSSDAAWIGSERLAHYITSKAAVVGLTRAMARDLGPSGITVNAVAPGIVETESSQGIPPERHAMYAAGRALKRPQMPSDVDGAVLFFLSEAASYITGQTLIIDGGYIMR
jgi:NAD(P)-dependent dehydrogenase (short-subunit alcohol dehydrogenase family)